MKSKILDEIPFSINFFILVKFYICTLFAPFHCTNKHSCTECAIFVYQYSLDTYSLVTVYTILTRDRCDRGKTRQHYCGLPEDSYRPRACYASCLIAFDSCLQDKCLTGTLNRIMGGESKRGMRPQLYHQSALPDRCGEASLVCRKLGTEGFPFQTEL